MTRSIYLLKLFILRVLKYISHTEKSKNKHEHKKEYLIAPIIVYHVKKAVHDITNKSST
jgi:hypothetical protein